MRSISTACSPGCDFVSSFSAGAAGVDVVAGGGGDGGGGTVVVVGGGGPGGGGGGAVLVISAIICIFGAVGSSSHFCELLCATF